MTEKEKTRDYKQWELISVLVVALFGITLIGITAASITVIAQSSTMSSEVDSSKVKIKFRIKPFNETILEFGKIKEEIKLKITELESTNKVCGTVPISQFKSSLRFLMVQRSNYYHLQCVILKTGSTLLSLSNFRYKQLE